MELIYPRKRMGCSEGRWGERRERRDAEMNGEVTRVMMLIPRVALDTFPFDDALGEAAVGGGSRRRRRRQPEFTAAAAGDTVSRELVHVARPSGGRRCVPPACLLSSLATWACLHSPHL